MGEHVSKFKVKDKVRILNGMETGTIGTVTSVSMDKEAYYGISIEGIKADLGYRECELEAVKAVKGKA